MDRNELLDKIEEHERMLKHSKQGIKDWGGRSDARGRVMIYSSWKKTAEEELAKLYPLLNK